MSYLDALLLAIRTVTANGAAVPFRPNANFVGATAADNPATNSTDITISNWTPGGALLWSPVSIVASLVTATTIAQPANSHSGGIVNDSTGFPFFSFVGGRSCSGVRFYWGSLAGSFVVRCSLWQNALASDSLRVINSAHVDVAVNGPGVYSGAFSSAVALVAGQSCIVSCWEMTGKNSNRFTGIGGTDANTLNNLFAQAGSGSPSGARDLAPGVTAAQIAGLSGDTSLFNLAGPGGGSAINYEPNAAGTGFAFVEPILT
jgi:hypothetical protein